MFTGCSDDCSHIEQCGDGDTTGEGNEACDPGTGAGSDPNGDAFCVGGFANGDPCTSPGTSGGVCLLGYCTGGTTGFLGAAGDGATCDDDCSAANCGDGHTNSVSGEQCDDGNFTTGDGCCDKPGGFPLSPSAECPRGQCVVEFCGDGIFFFDAVTEPDCDPCTADPNFVVGTCPSANASSAGTSSLKISVTP